MYKEWTRLDTIKRLLKDRRKVGLTDYATMVVWIAAFALVWGLIERAL